MNLFPKPRFKWKEPVEFAQRRREEEWKNRSFKDDIFGVFLFAVPMLLLWTFVKIADPEKPPSLQFAAALAILGGVFLVCLYRLLHRFVSSTEVKFFVKRLVYFRGGQTTSLNWRGVATYRVEEADDCRVLTLDFTSGRVIKFGLAPEIQGRDLHGFFTEIGVTMSSE